MADNRIQGRVALVTGASGGIGSACAQDLFLQGAHLALTYSKNPTACEDLVASLRTSYPQLKDQRISTHRVDVGNPAEIEALIPQIEKEHGTGPDILVSNAGYGKRIVDIEDIPLEEFEYTMDVNARASFLLVKSCVPNMRSQHWGRIVFISSIAAYGAGINGCHYASSKGALTSMMKNLSSHLAKYGITVNDVAPAMVEATGMIPNASAIPEVAASIPVGRLCTPQEVANVVRMFVTTGYATGQSFLLAGGLRIVS